MTIQISTPIRDEVAAALRVGDTVEITGYILCGRDAVLPKVVECVKAGRQDALGVDLRVASSFTQPSVPPASARRPATNWRSKAASSRCRRRA